jgi:hypothetical protein
MRRALFVLRTKAAVLENLPIAHALKATGNWEVEFLVDPAYAVQQVSLIVEAGFHAFHPSGKELLPSQKDHVAVTLSEAHPESHASCFRGWSLGSLRERIFRALPAIVRYALHYRSRIRRMRTFLSVHAPAVVVLSGDRQLGWELACIKASREAGIPTLITPYAIQFAEGIAVCRVRRADYRKRFAVSGIVRSTIAALFPDWTFVYRGERMLYYPVSEVLAAWVLGLMPKRPWTVGGGDATLMAIESAYAQKIFIEDGVHPDHMVITGKPCNDDIAREINRSHREPLRSSLGVPHGHKVVLCSIPQLAEHDLLPWDKHLQEVEFLLSTFAALKNVSTILSLHPKSDLARYQPLAEKHSAVIAKERIYTLQPICDVFVAGVSSTVTQAIGIGKPCVVIDYFGLDDRHYYDKAPGVIVVREREKLRPTLEAILRDESYYQGLVADQKKHSSQWALMDGKCTERMVQVIERLEAASEV